MLNIQTRLPKQIEGHQYCAWQDVTPSSPQGPNVKQVDDGGKYDLEEKWIGYQGEEALLLIIESVFRQ